ncbi:MAG: PIN domain-containing protein [Coriobacteriales bacterium]|jgi:predicted nucleic acid-binding protein|nr:PIN domain-containing protein [Coriobacteriales bacterium]
MKNELIVIDTNVLVSAFRSRRGASFRLVSLIGRGLFDIAVSVPMALEYEMMLKRIDSDKRPDDDAVDDALDYLFKVAKRVEAVHYLWRPFSTDPYDDHVVELTVVSGASAIVTFNKRDFKDISEFGIMLFTPVEYLRRLERS